MEQGVDRDTVQRLTALLAGDKAQRGAALAELSALAAGAGGAARNASQEAAVGVAAACVASLVAVLCEDISRVDPGEAREVSLVLASLMQLDPLLVAQEYIREGRLLKLNTTQGSALDVLFAKMPSDLSRDDVLLAACHMLPMAIIFSQGSTRVMVASGETDNDLEYWGRIFPVLPWHLVRAPTHARNRKLVLLALDVLRNPQGVSQIEVAGMWKFIFIATSGRPALFAEAVNAGLWELGTASLRAIPAAEQIGWRTAGGILAGSIHIAFRNICEHPPGIDPIKLLIDTGTTELMILALTTYESLGSSSAVYEGNVSTVVHILMTLQAFDITTVQAEPIYTMLQQIPSALRFAHDFQLDHVKGMGITSASQSLVLVALLFGKEEAGGNFSFNADSVNDLLSYLQEQLSGILVQFFPGLSMHWFKPAAHLCISDVNTALLIENKSASIPLLLEALFLEPDLVRPDVTGTTKATIQQCAAESILQVALFPPGRELLQQDKTVIEALHAVAEGKAWSAEAKVSATGALMALEGRAHEPAPANEGEMDALLHVMLSYQWDVQAVIERLVRSLQARGYITWFDLDCMKGSAMDAMSDAVDMAAVVLFGVSLAYKESANCRLEANYAHQQEKDMVPLMMQKDYNAKGTRLYYNFWDAEDLDEAAFEKRVDGLCREIGDRGRASDPSQKPMVAHVSEGVPPAPAPAPAPTPAPAPAPVPMQALAPTPSARAPAPSPAGAPTTPTPPASLPTEIGFSPSIQVQLPQQQLQQLATTTSTRSSEVGLSEVLRFVHEERQVMVVEMERQRQEMEAKIAELSPGPATEAVSEQQLVSLQARLESVHAAKLLSDAELFALEDAVADYVELQASMAGQPITEAMIYAPVAQSSTNKLHKLVRLSASMASDAAFARQVRRKFVSIS